MNLPNKLSLLRIILIPFFVAFFLIEAIPYGKLIATVIFIVAALTDLLDGKIARKYNMVTDTGKFLDPIADKMLVMSGVLVIFQHPFIPMEYLVVAGILIFSRDYLVNSLRQVGVAKGCVIAAAPSGKYKAASLDVALVLIMFYDACIQANFFNETIRKAIWWLALVALCLSIVLVIYSTIDYMIRNKAVLKSKENDNSDTKKN